MQDSQLVSMATDSAPVSWTDPNYVAAVVGVLAVGALYFYSAWTGSGPTADEITFVLAVVFLPTTLAYEIARRV